MIDDQDIFAVPDALEAMADLERNTSQEIIRQRASERVDIRTKVLIQAGNSSERHCFTVEGVTADISNGGSMVLTGRPIMPGDVFHVTFPATDIAIDSLLARCMRCRMVREDAFEIGFRFLNDIDLASALDSSDGQQW